MQPGGRDGAVEWRYLFVEKPVIERSDHLTLEDGLQLLEIEHHAVDRVGVALDGYFDHVVVPVSVGVGRVAEQTPVLLFRERGTGADMRRREFDFAGNKHPDSVTLLL